MNWEDEGYLISKNNYNENSQIAEFFTKKHGKCSGIIFGATSKKNKTYLQIGNKFHINYNFKNEGKSGYFKTEILEAKGKGTLSLSDQEVSELVRLVTGSIEKTFQNGLDSILAPLETQ